MPSRIIGWSRLRPYQRADALALASRQKAGVWMPPGTGKALRNDMPVLTPAGWVPIADLRVGDAVVDPDGGTAFVTGVYPQGTCEVFEVTTSDGASVVCTADHLWTVQTNNDRTRGTERTLSLCEMLSSGLTRRMASVGRDRHAYYLPLASPVEFAPGGVLPIDPYVLGVLLGDGALTKGAARFVLADDEIAERVRARLPAGLTLLRRAYAGHCAEWNIVVSAPRGRVAGAGRVNPLRAALRSLGLAGKLSVEKFIPAEYMHATVEERRELLRGLFDTDGSIAKDGRFSIFYTSSSRLAHDVIDLVRGLGGTTTLSYLAAPEYKYLGQRRTGRRSYRVFTRLRECPFSLSRKAVRWHLPKVVRAVHGARECGFAPCTCISVNSRRGLFVTKDFIVTHNTCIALAALALADVKWPALIVTKSLGRRVWPRDARWVLGSDYVPGIVDGFERRHGDNLHDEGVHADNDWSPKSAFVQPVTYSDVEAALARHPAVVVSYDVLERADLWTVPWGAFVLDEAHAVRGGHLPARKRVRHSDGTLGWSGQSARYELCRDMASLVRSRGGIVWQMTATPMPDRRRDLFGQLNIALPNQFSNGLSFLKTFCNFHMKQIVKGGEVLSVPDSTGKSNSPLLKQICGQHFIIHSRDELASQLPKLQLVVKNMPADQKSVRHLGGSVETAIARSAAVKLPAALEIAAEYLTTKAKVAITVTRRELARKLDAKVKEQKFLRTLPREVRDKLVFECVTGEVPPLERSARLDAFNELDCPGILCATSDSLAESINLHKVHAAIVLGLPYSSGQVQQLLGRFNRLGGVASVINFVVAEGTIDERIRDTLLDKLMDAVDLNADTQGGDAIASALRVVRDDVEVMAGLQAWLNGGE